MAKKDKDKDLKKRIPAQKKSKAKQKAKPKVKEAKAFGYEEILKQYTYEDLETKKQPSLEEPVAEEKEQAPSKGPKLSYEEILKQQIEEEKKEKEEIKGLVQEHKIIHEPLAPKQPEPLEPKPVEKKSEPVTPSAEKPLEKKPEEKAIEKAVEKLAKKPEEKKQEAEEVKSEQKPAEKPKVLKLSKELEEMIKAQKPMPKEPVKKPLLGKKPNLPKKPEEKKEKPGISKLFAKPKQAVKPEEKEMPVKPEKPKFKPRKPILEKPLSKTEVKKPEMPKKPVMPPKPVKPEPPVKPPVEKLKIEKPAFTPSKPARPKARKKSKLMPIIILGVLIVGIFLVLKFFPPMKIFQKHAEMMSQQLPERFEETEAVQVKAFKTAFVRFEDSLAIMGTIKGYRQVDLRFATNGKIERFNFREGDFVKEGDVIAKLVPTEALLRIGYNENKLAVQQKKQDIAESKLEKKKIFFEAGAIIESEVKDAELEYQAASRQVALTEKELELAQNEFEKTELKSPMNAFMGTREADPGEFVTANTKIGSIFDIESVFVELGIIEKDIRKIKPGQKLEIFVDAYPGITFDGTIDTLPAVLEGKSRTMPLKVKIKNDNNLLKPGMFVRSRVFVFENDNALIVPSLSLIDSDGDGMFDSIFVIEYGTSVKLRQVEVGYTTTDYAEIISGLDEGEEIVVETAGRLEDGTQVEVTEVQEYGM